MEIDLIIPIIRQILQIVGGYMIGHGWLDDAGLDALMGLIVNALVFLWWLIEHVHLRKRVKEAEQKVNAP